MQIVAETIRAESGAISGIIPTQAFDTTDAPQLGISSTDKDPSLLVTNNGLTCESLDPYAWSGSPSSESLLFCVIFCTTQNITGVVVKW